jgi:GDP-4-dehydro-6-deoxy-D-mannose reductase
MTTALVTGAAGFIAGHLLAALRASGPLKIAGADLLAAPKLSFDAWHAVDLTDVDAVRRLVVAEQPAVVFHLAGLTRGSPAEITSSNAHTARAMLDAVCAEAPAAHVVLMGSAAEYGAVPKIEQPVKESFTGNPANAYGQAKQAVSALAVKYSRERGVNVAVARPSNVIGAGIPSTLVVGAIVQRLRAALAGPPPRSIAIGSTSAVRDFVAVNDVAEGLVRIWKYGRTREAYNLCSGQGHAVSDVLARLLALAREPVAVRQQEDLVRPGEADVVVCSRDKAAHDLGWRPKTSLDESLRAAWEFPAAARSTS